MKKQTIIGATALLIAWQWLVLARLDAEGLQEANAVSLDGAIRAYSKSASLVENYDVYLSAARDFEMKAVAENRPAGQPPIGFKWVPYGANEARDSQISRYRQAISHDNCRRIEELNADGSIARTIVFDGELVGVLNATEKTGLIVEPKMSYMTAGEDYLTLFRCAFNSVAFSSIFAERKELLTIENDRATGLVKLTCPPKPATSNGDFGWRLWLDSNNGFLPKKIERCRDKMDQMESRLEITETIQLPAGTSVPTTAILTEYDAVRDRSTFGKRLARVVFIVDRAKSVWNIDARQDTFRLAFPRGTIVSDQIQRKEIVAGDATTLQSFEHTGKTQVGVKDR